MSPTTSLVELHLNADLERRATLVEQAIGEAQIATPAVTDNERRIARLRLALAERSAVQRAVDDEIVSEPAAEGRAEPCHQPHRRRAAGGRTGLSRP